MTNNMHVEFLGLTSVVPNRVKGDDKFSSYLVVLPNLEYGWYDTRLPIDTKPGEEDNGERTTYVPPHVPAVIVPADAVLRESYKRAALTFECRKGPFGGNEYALYLFRQEKLSFRPLPRGPVEANYRPVDPADELTQKPRNAGDEHGLQWIPNLALANHQTGERTGEFDRRKYLNDDNTPRFTGGLRLAGTIPIDQGRFYVKDVVPHRGKPGHFKMEVPNTGDIRWRQSIYSSIAWDSGFIGDRLDLIFSSGSRDGEGIVSLKPIKGHCDIWIANLELESLLQTGSETERQSSADIDFASSYLFCTDVPQGRNMPVPHSLPIGIGGSSPRCKSAMFGG